MEETALRSPTDALKASVAQHNQGIANDSIVYAFTQAIPGNVYDGGSHFEIGVSEI